MSAAELAAALDPVLARGAVRGMVTLEIVSEPVTPELVARVDSYTKTLGVDENMLQVARDYSQGAMDVAQQDYLRNSYVLEYYTQHGNDGSLHRTVRQPGDRSPLDPALEAKWKTLETCPEGSLGRTVWDFYQRRGFSLPGSPGSVDPCSRSTTSCTASPTTGRRPPVRSRCSRSSPRRSPTRAASVTWS